METTLAKVAEMQAPAGHAEPQPASPQTAPAERGGRPLLSCKRWLIHRQA